MSVIAIGVLLVALAAAFWRISGLHQELADAYALVARMLRAPDMASAEREALEHRRRKIAQARWRS
jgi:hypothetical protein